MKLIDANLLLYAYDDRSPHHTEAKRWLEGVLSGTETVAFAWVVLLAFLRLTTNPRVFEQPFDIADALDVVDGWLSAAPSTVVHPTALHATHLRRLLEPLGTAGNITTDAHLAALAIEHRAELCSCDGDFGRFAGLRWANPLGPSG